MSGKYLGNTSVAARADLDALHALWALLAGGTLTVDVIQSLTGNITFRSQTGVTLGVWNGTTGILTLASGLVLAPSTIAGASLVIPAGVAPVGGALGDGSLWFDGTKLMFQNGTSKELIENPMTAVGDMLIGGIAGAPASLPIGPAGWVLTVVGGVIQWAAPGGGGGAGAQKRVPFLYDSSTTHVVSADVTRIDIEVWGAGGGAGAGSGVLMPGAGGGYAMTANVVVAPSDSLAVTVGAGGAKGGGSANGAAGGNSKVVAAGPTTLAEAAGGGGGDDALAFVPGGGKVTGDYGMTGESTVGHVGDLTLPFWPGGAGANGGSGGKTSDTTGGTGFESLPQVPGGGGTFYDGDDSKYQDGADGRVIIWEYQP